MDSQDNPFKNSNFFQSFTCAIQGFKQAIKSERNLKIHLFLALLAIILASYFKFESLKWMILLLTIGIVIFSELINTAIEAVIDLVVEDQWHPLAKKAKDIAAAAVLITAIISVLIGALLFFPYIF
ncbi:diacylglycerol kinase [Facklamia sp. 7083-14-GEN3]|uniref:diacylglycerol kinase n=1 Tax=Facklamia sp. 7083-14-GEN3 TaxID=2973478 RepID=UPI00215BD8D7|nr:diacylglycerol kinase family protein [Facklamia sp. 7083-14-GEN3]MCR8968706.1 diacylglycerol kinase family protein [Facklamia sp. 7083-14-GEN3]